MKIMKQLSFFGMLFDNSRMHNAWLDYQSYSIKKKIGFWLGAVIGFVLANVIDLIAFVIAYFWEFLTAILCTGLIWILVGCENPQSVNNNKEATMSQVRFFNHFLLDLPASPGASGTHYDLVPYDNKEFFGISTPFYKGAAVINPPNGCLDDSQITLLEYRYTFLGALGLRPANASPALANGVYVKLNRKIAGFDGVGSDRVFLPFISNNWETINVNLELVDGLSPNRVPEYMDSDIYIDTRNLQSIYYGTNVSLLLEIKGTCPLTEN